MSKIEFILLNKQCAVKTKDATLSSISNLDNYFMMIVEFDQNKLIHHCFPYQIETENQITEHLKRLESKTDPHIIILNLLFISAVTSGMLYTLRTSLFPNLNNTARKGYQVCIRNGAQRVKSSSGSFIRLNISLKNTIENIEQIGVKLPTISNYVDDTKKVVDLLEKHRAQQESDKTQKREDLIKQLEERREVCAKNILNIKEYCSALNDERERLQKQFTKIIEEREEEKKKFAKMNKKLQEEWFTKQDKRLQELNTEKERRKKEIEDKRQAMLDKMNETYQQQIKEQIKTNNLINSVLEERKRLEKAAQRENEEMEKVKAEELKKEYDREMKEQLEIESKNFLKRINDQFQKQLELKKIKQKEEEVARKFKEEQEKEYKKQLENLYKQFVNNQQELIKKVEIKKDHEKSVNKFNKHLQKELLNINSQFEKQVEWVKNKMESKMELIQNNKDDLIRMEQLNKQQLVWIDMLNEQINSYENDSKLVDKYLNELSNKNDEFATHIANTIEIFKRGGAQIDENRLKTELEDLLKFQKTKEEQAKINEKQVEQLKKSQEKYVEERERYIATMNQIVNDWRNRISEEQSKKDKENAEKEEKRKVEYLKQCEDALKQNYQRFVERCQSLTKSEPVKNNEQINIKQLEKKMELELQNKKKRWAELQGERSRLQKQLQIQYKTYIQKKEDEKVDAEKRKREDRLKQLEEEKKRAREIRAARKKRNNKSLVIW